MNLKQILPKVVASVVSAYMIVGNATIAGIGLGEVIAADTQAPAVAITTEVQKYIQYDKEGNKGAIVQEKISLAEQCDENTYLPTKRVTIQETVPVINGVLPSRVSIMGASVSLTKGSGQISQSYQADTGLFNIAYENQAPEENYQEHATDEFEIVYIYPEDAYLGNQEKCEIVQQVRANVTYQAKNQELSIEKTEGFKTAQTSNVGEIVNNQIIDVTKVYKGFLYTNERNKTNYETEYKTKSKLSVANKDVVDNIKIELAPSKYIYTDNKEEKELDTDTIQYHDTKITESDFQKLFGIEGYIDFYLENDKYATIRYADADKDGNRSFATYYYGEAPQGAEAGKVIYPENTKAVTMVTGKPQTEGNAYIETGKTMLATQNYGVAVENLKAIKEEITTQAIKNKTVEQEKKNDNGENIFDEQGNPVKEQVTKEVTMSSNKNIGTIQLREPETQMSFEVSNQNLSTLAANQTTLTVKLDDTNSSCELLKAGTMTITLPKNMTNVKISGAQMLYGNGLTIKENVTIKDGKIIIPISGEQKSYDVNNVNGGVNIVINLENITFAITTPNHRETLQVSYANKTATSDINIVSKAGLLMIDKVETSEGASATSIDNAEKNVSLAMNKKGQTIEKTLYLVNNYDKELSNINVIGVIGNKSAEEKANITATLAETIKVAGVKADIYYSKTGNDDDWSTKVTSETTVYKVVFKEALQPTSTATVTLKLNVPDDLSYNTATYLNEKVMYHYGDATLLQTDSTKFATAEHLMKVATKAATMLASNETKGIISASIETDATVLGIDENMLYNKGDIVEYHIIVKNQTTEILNNVRIEQNLPEHLEYTEGGIATKDMIDNSEDYTGFTIQEKGKVENSVFKSIISELKPNEEKYVVVRYKVQKLTENYETTVETMANIYVNDEIYQTNIQRIKIDQPNYEMSLVSNVGEGTVLKAGETVTYTANIKNTGKSMTELDVQDNIPEQIEVTKLEYLVDETVVDSFNTSSQKIVVTRVLQPDSTLTIKITGKVKEIENEKAQIITVENMVTLNDGESQQNSNTVAIKIQTLGEGEENNSTEDINSISGTAWIDANKDGKRDNGEDLLKDITVTLINSDTGAIAQDKNNNNITTKTDDNGKYQFKELDNGNYMVMFEFDTNKYTMTTYHKKSVKDDQNSDAIMNNVNINGETKRVGITDKLKVKDNAFTNIDIGLIEATNFDLSITKQISKVTITSPKGTKTKEYKNKNFVKVDISSKYINSTNLAITYKFIVKNEGDVPGYVNKVVDNLPSGLSFDSSLNKDWYKGADGKLYNNSLSDNIIQSGETKEVELTLTKKMTENSLGTFTNNAEITEMSNIQAIQETATDNNKSSANLIISIATGAAMMYIGITIGCIAVVAGGTYLIKKKVTEEEKF